MIASKIIMGLKAKILEKRRKRRILSE